MSTSALLALTLTFCAPAAEPDLLVAGAADLTPLEAPLTQECQRVTGLHVRFTFGASGMLARQIEQGAPYDVFVSANEQYVSELVKSGHVAGDSVRTYAFGRLGLWSKDGSVKTLADLTNPKLRHLAIANPAHAPYGAAARELLTSKGLWKQLEPKIVYGENVRQALQFAESGNAEAVITAWSLLYNRGAIQLDASAHAPIVQAAGVVKGRPSEAAARRFIAFLTGPEGRKLLEAHGLSVPGK